MENNIENLKLLQNIDSLLGSLNQKLTRAQNRIVLAKEGIVAENKKLVDFEASLKNALAERAALKVERESLDEKVVKYKIQHATLKKNDEYQAMQLTIDRTKEEISKVEDIELELLFKIEELEANLEAKREECKANLANIDEEISRLEGEAKAVEVEIEVQKSNREAQSKNVAESFYTVYDRLSSSGKKLPFLVKVEDSKCTGCHLKISVSLSYASKDATKEPVVCEHCGRILYA